MPRSESGAIQAAIWENQTPNGARFNVTLSRLYKEDESWKSSRSFRRDDLLLLANVADRAHDLICELQQRESSRRELAALATLQGGFTLRELISSHLTGAATARLWIVRLVPRHGRDGTSLRYYSLLTIPEIHPENQRSKVSRLCRHTYFEMNLPFLSLPPTAARARQGRKRLQLKD